MPITHTILPDLKLAISTHEGTVSDEEFIAAYTELVSMPSFELNFNQLIDLRKTHSQARSQEALHTLADLAAQRFIGPNLHRKTALIAPSELSFGLGRMYEAFSPATSGTLVVFRKADAALVWLGAPEDTLPG